MPGARLPRTVPLAPDEDARAAVSRVLVRSARGVQARAARCPCRRHRGGAPAPRRGPPSARHPGAVHAAVAAGHGGDGDRGPRLARPCGRCGTRSRRPRAGRGGAGPIVAGGDACGARTPPPRRRRAAGRGAGRDGAHARHAPQPAGDGSSRTACCAPGPGRAAPRRRGARSPAPARRRHPAGWARVRFGHATGGVAPPARAAEAPALRLRDPRSARARRHPAAGQAAGRTAGRPRASTRTR